MATTDPAAMDVLGHVQGILSTQVPNSPIYNFLFTDLIITSAEAGHITASLTLASQHVNSRGALHGAVSASLVDLMGGLAIASMTRQTKTGASVDIHVTYQSTASVEDVLQVDAYCQKAGRNLGFTRVECSRMKGDQRILVASGTHTKFLQQ